MSVLRSLVFVVVSLCLVTTPAFAVEVEGYRAPGVWDADAAEQQQAALSAWLVSEQASKALQQPLAVSVTADDMEVMEAKGLPNEATTKMLVGVTKELDAFVDLESPEVGAVSAAKTGVRIWTGAVRSAGASALRIHFTDFALPEGAEVYIYNQHGEAFGPYTGSGLRGDNDFWSHTVTGDTLLVQARTPVDAGHGFFTIAEVGHFGSDFAYAGYRNRSLEKSLCGYNASCVQPNSGTDDSIAHYTFIQRPYMYMCTGGLIATQPASGIPYFLTANHCLSRGREAGTVETYFFYSGGDSACSGATAQHNVGSSVIATNKTGDFTLLQLDGSAPSGAFFRGFTTDEVADTNGYKLFRVSHPSGAPQAYSTHDVDTGAGTCSSWPRGSWIYSKDKTGATEGGSSGSPVYNSQGLIVGQLSGACGYNLNDVCDNVSNSTVDGALASYYSQVQPFLGGGGSGCTVDSDGDGYFAESCGGDDCNDGVFAINPGATEICDDFVDNNCNGQIDEDCGGGSCLPRGDACSSNSECCSLRCHPKKNTCS